MHKDDQMTPLERLNGFLTGGEMDRLLTMPFIMSMSGKAAGMTHKQKRSTGENEAFCQIESYKRWGNDLLIVEYGLHTFGIELGSVVADPEDAVPHITDWVLKDINDWENLPWEKIEPENSEIFKLHLDAVRRCISEVGNEVPTGLLAGMPFTAIASIMGTEKLLKACRKNPDVVKGMMRRCTDLMKQVHNAYIKEGAMMLLCEPIGSGSIVPAKTFHEFIEPYMTEIVENIKDQGGMCCYHICGNSMPIIENMIASQPHMISVDNRVDLAEAKAKVEPFMPIVGNVDTVDAMVLGTPEEVEASVKESIRKGYDAQHGYVLATGCDLNVNVPLENMDAFMAAARKYGKLPIDPSTWE
ncbi:MAG: uroporphyrinogen decarboxylase family protein [Eggerthellaceae bacterium]|nr:uroporphyrinogen decarboxylase family protein [Eggerthellaceae bacterium]